MSRTAPRGLSLEQRLWRRVRKSESCWVWEASVGGPGYGQIMMSDRRVLKAHRVSWELANGPVPPGVCVLHRCDNRRCVRPDHLFLGTLGDNNRDRAVKGRSATKLAASEAVEIRRRAFAGESQKQLAAEYGVAVATVSAIKLRRLWKHLP